MQQRSSKIAKNDPSTDAERHLSYCGLLTKPWMPTITILNSKTYKNVQK
jgi:hypothetical protein